MDKSAYEKYNYLRGNPLTFLVRCCHIKTKTITQLGVLLAIALAVQSLRLPSYITGPVINTVLIVASVMPGVLGGLFIGSITPIAALALGIMPPAAAPLVPVIIAANSVLVTTFGLVHKRNKHIAFVAAALTKYFVFYIVLNELLLIIGIKLPPPVLAAFQLPQLYTALVGGFVGTVIINRLQQESVNPAVTDDNTGEKC